MYYTDPVISTARKEHKCTYCAEPIPIGERYWRWVSFDTEGGFSNKLHSECWDAVTFGCDGQFEYCPFSNERPERVAESES